MMPSAKRTGTGAAGSGRGPNKMVRRISRPIVVALLNDLTVKMGYARNSQEGLTPFIIQPLFTMETPYRFFRSSPKILSRAGAKRV